MVLDREQRIRRAANEHVGIRRERRQSTSERGHPAELLPVRDVTKTRPEKNVR